MIQKGSDRPHLFGVVPPKPRIEGVRIVDVGSSNSWAEFATLFCSTQAAFLFYEAKFMLPWSFSEGAAAEKYMAQLQANKWVTNARRAALSIITGGAKWVEIAIAASHLRLACVISEKLGDGDSLGGRGYVLPSADVGLADSGEAMDTTVSVSRMSRQAAFVPFAALRAQFNRAFASSRSSRCPISE
jgi:hypothetical protein